MTISGTTVDGSDSLDASADLLDWRESYGDYCSRMAEEDAAEHSTADEAGDEAWGSLARPDDRDPEPPSPAAPALRPLPSAPCPCCHGYGAYPKYPTVCRYCNGSGEDHLANSTQVTAHDRIERLRQLGQSGGLTTLERYGRTYFRTIGKAGYAATAARHGERYARDILRAKGWQSRRPDLVADLVADLSAGRVLAELAKAA